MDLIVTQKFLNEQEIQEFQSEQLSLKLYNKFPSDLQKHQFILVRHGYSLYNFKAQMYRLDNQCNDRDPLSAEYRFDRSLIDPPLHQYGIYQCLVASDTINKIDFELIFASPMRRTLETTLYLFRNYQKATGKKLKVIVLPLITEVLNTLCDLSPSTKDTVRQEFEKIEELHFDFGLMDSLKEQNFWQVENIQDQKLKNQVYEQLAENKEDPINAFVEVFKGCFPDNYETPTAMYLRASQAQSFIREYLEQNFPTSLHSIESQIAIISHHNFLQTTLSKGVNEAGKLIEPYDMENCEMIPFTI